MQLTEHFSLQEMCATQVRYDNTPTKIALANLQLLCEKILEPARTWIGPIHVNSGYRTWQGNMAINGFENSQHMRGEAADIVPVNLTLNSTVEAFHKIRQSDIPYDQLIYEKPTKISLGWIHISTSSKPRKQVLVCLAPRKFEPFTGQV